jgi:hypothetical protein
MRRAIIDDMVDYVFYDIPPEKYLEYIEAIRRSYFIDYRLDLFDCRAVTDFLVKNPQHFDIKGEADIDRAREANGILHSIYFITKGRRIYAPVEDLCVALLNTKVPDNIAAEQVHVEGDCFFISLPDSAFHFPNSKVKEGRYGYLDGINVYMYRDPENPDNLVWCIFFLGLVRDNSIVTEDYEEMNFFTEVLFLTIEKEATLQQAINQAQVILGFNQDLADIFEFITKMLMFLRLSPNLLREIVDHEYVELVDKARSVKSPAKQRKLKQRIKRTSPSQVTVLTPNRQYVDRLKVTTSTGKRAVLNTEESRRIMREHIVSGHMRHQPYGSRKNPEYKWIWIYPYWRGAPKDSVKQSKTIVVK